MRRRVEQSEAGAFDEDANAVDLLQAHKARIAAARAKGKHPGRWPLDRDRVEAALKLVAAGQSPTAAARQVGRGRSTVYRELRRARADRLTAPA